MAEDPVNPQITGAVTQTNVKTLGESPAEALGAVYQAMAQPAGSASENAAQAGEVAANPADDNVAPTK